VDQEDNIEERIVAKRVAKPKGVRLWFSLVMVLLGIALVAGGFFGASVVEIRLVMILGGLALILGFGWLVVGGNKINFRGSADGSMAAGMELPQDTTVRTTIRKRGFPRRGAMPPKHGAMPPRDGDPPGGVGGPDSENR
jgi:hypothetical protein